MVKHCQFFTQSLPETIEREFESSVLTMFILQKQHIQMKKTFALFLLGLISMVVDGQDLPSNKDIKKTLRLTNQYFMDKWPDAGKSIFTNIERPSNIWTRAVYYEGLVALYAADKKKKGLQGLYAAMGRETQMEPSGRSYHKECRQPMLRANVY